MLKSFAKTHIGQRQVNEDRCFIDKDIGLYIVADGVGGMDKGELASKLACDAIEDCIKSGQTLSESVYSAHKAIINEININQQQQGMATTITAVLFNNNSYEVAWVGDSRLYLWDGNLKLLTRDDSYVELLLENGHISIDDLETHPDRNIISQALGIERKKLAINSNSGTLEKDELLLLCTDGLYSIASEEIIINAINKISDVEKLTEHLVQIAVDKDGKDNISLISIRSDTNVPTTDNKIIPNIVRQFDAVTGKMRGVASAT
ncbi:Protein serine/threonine phosphatase PrpC, regulation of stationary phase, partial [hydrothermal vent metagenome]